MATFAEEVADILDDLVADSEDELGRALSPRERASLADELLEEIGAPTGNDGWQVIGNAFRPPVDNLSFFGRCKRDDRGRCVGDKGRVGPNERALPSPEPLSRKSATLKAKLKTAQAEVAKLADEYGVVEGDLTNLRSQILSAKAADKSLAQRTAEGKVGTRARDVTGRVSVDPTTEKAMKRKRAEEAIRRLSTIRRTGGISRT